MMVLLEKVIVVIVLFIISLLALYAASRMVAAGWTRGRLLAESFGKEGKKKGKGSHVKVR
jgi:hypothetical protein